MNQTQATLGRCSFEVSSFHVPKAPSRRIITNKYTSGLLFWSLVFVYSVGRLKTLMEPEGIWVNLNLNWVTQFVSWARCWGLIFSILCLFGYILICLKASIQVQPKSCGASFMKFRQWRRQRTHLVKVCGYSNFQTPLHSWSIICLNLLTCMSNIAPPWVIYVT